MNIRNLKNKTKDFCKKKKRKIRIGLEVAVGATAVVAIINSRNKSNVINDLKRTITSERQAHKKLCDEKDKFFASFISKLLRDGNSEGGRQMAYRKQWLMQDSQQVV